MTKPHPYRSTRTALCAALCLALAGPLAAQTTAAPAAATPRPQLVPVFAPDAALLAAFGGVPGITRLTADFADRLRADARIGHYFEKTKLPLFKQQLADQFCQVLAGPCVYDGDTMKAAHADLKINRADSLALVEVLQTAMDQQGIAFTAQNQLLARLAPMTREIITR
jgi:hemoglobin